MPNAHLANHQMCFKKSRTSAHNFKIKQLLKHTYSYSNKHGLRHMSGRIQLHPSAHTLLLILTSYALLAMHHKVNATTRTKSVLPHSILCEF